jgi:prophage antirepressor-like protein
LLFILQKGDVEMIKLFKEKNIRMIWSENGIEIWLNASDVAEELGILNIRQNLTNFNKENKKKITNQMLSGVYNTYSRNFNNELNNFGEVFIDELTVYNMAFRSNKAEAKLFTQWVCEVIKSIRINGYYIANEKDELWLGVRSESKKARRTFTDEIQEFVYYALQQGSSKPEMYYKHFTSLVNSKLNIPGNLNRDELSQDTLMDIMALERIMAMKLPKLVNAQTPYKQVYQEIKKLISDI